uniref:Transmembrane protein n=1 Tax=Clandestinovirus TaxID=2831644 RepID=A0A8F8KT90_9VIRU|nr:transmembrane protein [Clandestinovirus]
MASKLCISTPSLHRRLACLLVGGVVLPSATVYGTWTLLDIWVHHKATQHRQSLPPHKPYKPYVRKEPTRIEKALIWIEENVDLTPKTTAAKKTVAGLVIGVTGLCTAIGAIATVGMAYDGVLHARQTFKMLKDPSGTQMCCTLVRRGLFSVGGIGTICLTAALTTAGANLTRTSFKNYRFIQ